MDAEEIFRDSSDWYLRSPSPFSGRVLEFALRNSGHEVLDVGCAVGEYSRRLNQAGHECIGVDINKEYLARAAQKAVQVGIMDAAHLGFADRSFDTVLLVEVLEHVEDPKVVIQEAKRVSKGTVVITVPNCSDFHRLRESGLTYEHMLERGHRNFFTKRDLEELLNSQFKSAKVTEGDPIEPCGILGSRILRYVVRVANGMGVGRRVHSRLYAVAEV